MQKPADKILPKLKYNTYDQWLVIGPWCWCRHEDLNTALYNLLNRAGISDGKVKLAVYRCGEDAHLNGMGSICNHFEENGGLDPVEVLEMFTEITFPKIKLDDRYCEDFEFSTVLDAVWQSINVVADKVQGLWKKHPFHDEAEAHVEATQKRWREDHPHG